MCNLETYKIDLRSLKFGLTKFEWQLDDSYFAQIEGADVQRGRLAATIEIDRTMERSFDVRISVDGEVTLPCDRCLDDMQVPVEGRGRVAVKLGEKASEEDDLIVVDERDGWLQLAWLVYEQIALSLPLQHVHEPGGCNAEMVRMIDGLSVDASKGSADEQPADPRWSALQKLRQQDGE